MKLRWAIIIASLVFALLALAVYFAPGHQNKKQGGLNTVAEWQRMANPGELVAAHAFLDHNCMACHTPVKGVEAINCITCHANEETLLNRQPTSFHADISSCKECHIDHRGREANISVMDHGAISEIGLRQLSNSSELTEVEVNQIARLKQWLDQDGKSVTSITSNPHLSQGELALNCATCHQNEDRHLGLFGSNCSVCHETKKWTIPEFKHPPASSMDCAQCHEAPPSHYMGHFNMISQKVAGKPHARVDQCFECHQTTSWNDIIDVGWYKHH
ncbi:MAG: hypothetical protein KJT03_02175 [Verrucomicrobiae bacterium]|nr:hypothetical protein [Verrucomicrobiae bacterium]